MYDVNQKPEKDIWATMRENRLRKERRNNYLIPICNLVGLVAGPGMAWFMISELPCNNNQQIAHIGWQNNQLIQFQPVKAGTTEELWVCTLHNSSVIYNAGGDAFHHIQTHSGEILAWGCLFILFCAGLQLLLWSIKSIFS